MDPISGVASVVAIISAANTTIHSINRIRSLAKAPKAINELIDEVEALRRLLTDIQQLCEPMEAHRLLLLREFSDESSNVSPKSNSLLSVYLTQARKKLAELDELIDKNFKEGSGRLYKGPRGACLAWLSSERRVNALRNDIHSINTSITACLAMTAVTAQFRLQNYLKEATSGTTEIVFSHTRTNKVRSGVDSPHDSQLERMNSSIDNDQRRNDSVHPRTSLPSLLGMDMSQNENYCKSCCACCCHKRTRIQMSSVVGNLMGSLYLIYSNGYSHLPCNENSCQRRLQITLNLTYHFPRWLLSRVLNTYWGLDSIGCPTVALRMPRIRPDTAPIFHLAAAGDIAGMRRMFRLGLASPDDVSHAFGYSVLHVSQINRCTFAPVLTLSQFAVDMEDIEAIKFLIGEGANPMLANRLNL